MQPLTFRKLLFHCLLLLIILFLVVVVALKFGAVPVSLYALGRDLLRVVLGQSSQMSSDYGLIIQNIRLPRIILGILVGASLSVAGTSFQALLPATERDAPTRRSEEHTSELQSHHDLVCRLLLEKTKLI